MKKMIKINSDSKKDKNKKLFYLIKEIIKHKEKKIERR